MLVLVGGFPLGFGWLNLRCYFSPILSKDFWCPAVELDILNVGFFGTLKNMEAGKRTFCFCLISGWADRVGVLKVESDYPAAVNSPFSCSWQAAVMSTPSPPCQCQLGRDLWMAPQALRLKELGGSCTHSSAVTCKDNNPLQREWTNGSDIGYG